MKNAPHLAEFQKKKFAVAEQAITKYDELHLKLEQLGLSEKEAMNAHKANPTGFEDEEEV